MKRFFKIIGVIALVAIVGAGGYIAGTRAQQSSIASAIPRAAIEKQQGDIPESEPSAEPEQKNPPETERADKTLAKEVRIISKTESSAAKEGWTVINESDNPQGGSVKLYTSAQRDGNEIAWDDSQQWLLEYDDGNGGYYQLVSKYITSGSVYFDIFEDENGERKINAYIMTGAGTVVTQYSMGENGFEEQTIYNSGAVNKIVSTVPSYR